MVSEGWKQGGTELGVKEVSAEAMSSQGRIRQEMSFLYAIGLGIAFISVLDSVDSRSHFSFGSANSHLSLLLQLCSFRYNYL